METDPPWDPRRQADRRRRPTDPWAALRLRPGRRMAARRAHEHAAAYHVDRFSAGLFAMILLFLGLSIADGAITLYLLGERCEEINPVMRLLLERGHLAFIVGKYALTAAGIPLILVFKNHYLFGSRFRAGYLIPLFVGLYLVLVVYQMSLLGRAAAPAAAESPLVMSAGRARST